MSYAFKAVSGLIILFAIGQQSNAQYKNSGYEIGLNVGTLVYKGDISRSFLGDWRAVKPAIGLSVSKSIDNYFAVRASLLRGSVSGDESVYQTPAWMHYRKFSFKSTLTEMSALAVFSPYGESQGNNYRRVSPYFFAGIGFSLLNTRRDWSRYDTTVFTSKSTVAMGLGIDTVHSLPGVIPILPVGAGLRYALSPQWSLNAEATYRFTTTDYLDGFKYAGNPKRRDGYYGISLGLSYRFGNYKCPPVR